MKSYIFVALLLLVSTGRAQRSSISGRVTDALSGATLVAANVTASSTRLNILTGSATDANGNYAIRNLPAGTYIIQVSYIGYERVEIQVNLAPGEQVERDFVLEPAPIQFETYVVTASRRRERIEDAPAAISVINEQAIRRESNTNLGDYLKSVKGVDFTQSGVDSYNLSARGFNSSFSSRLLTLTDGRMANIPSLRLIAYNAIPVSFEDVKQFEVVLGPSSALYGPNAHSGVLNIVTKSPRESVGTTVNVQAGSRRIRKLSLRHASTIGPVGLKLSAVALNAEDWEHVNSDEYEGHDPAFIGRPYQLRDHVANDGRVIELGNPTFTTDLLAQLMDGEIADNGIDDNGNGFIDETGDWAGLPYGDGKDNLFGDGEKGARITQEMIDEAASDPFNRYFVPGTDIVLWWVSQDDLSKAYADGKDNDADGLIDENIDNGIDDEAERWYDGVDNDGDGQVDEKDEIGSPWLTRFGAGDEFGEYIYDAAGNILCDTNNDGIYGGEGDVVLGYGDPRWIMDANSDGINDFPVFDVKNYRYDLRVDFDPNPRFQASLSHGSAWAHNINITGIARLLADGWIYQYYQGRLRYKNIFMQAYLNTSYSGSPLHPTRNLATGEPVFDRSKKFSAQFQHYLDFFGDRLRFVWGLDYFLTLPDTRGTILSDKQLFDRQDNNGDGEAGSPISFNDANDNFQYDPGEKFVRWATDNGKQNGEPASLDTVLGAISDGIDNDGDGLVDEGIDERTEDNRRVVNELGAYYQLNWKLSEKLELVQATRFDAHDRLTDLIDFNNDHYNYSPTSWRFDFDKREGLQVSPKIGLVYKPAEHQSFRLTWAKAYNTPSNQALFLDIFVTRTSVFRVFAQGAEGGYLFPRAPDRQIYFQNVKNFRYEPMDTTRHIAFYLSADPRIEGYFKNDVPDLPEIDAEIVHTLEVGYKGRLYTSLYGTLDVFRSHYSSFISAVAFITPAIVNKSILTTDYDGDGVINTDPDYIVDQEDLEEARRQWNNKNFFAGIAAMDTTPELNAPIVVGYMNYGQVDMWGFDMSLTWFINRNLTLDLNYSFISISDFFNPVTDAKDPINAPRHKVGLKLQYLSPQEKFTCSLNYRYVDSFFWASGVYFGKIPTYSIVDFHTRYQFSDHLSGMLTANNLLDNRHVEIIGGPALGMSMIFRLQATL